MKVITLRAAAEMIHRDPAILTKLAKRKKDDGTYLHPFFVTVPSGKAKVDTDHPAWAKFVAEKRMADPGKAAAELKGKARKRATARKTDPEQNRPDAEPTGEQSQVDQARESRNRRADELDTNDMELLILEEQREKVRKLKIANAQALDELIPVTFYEAMQRAFIAAVQTNLVDVPRRTSRRKSDTPNRSTSSGNLWLT